MGAGPAGRAERGSEPVPERLLKAATKLFAVHGFENTSVQQIVAEAGVTKGAMYHYFAAKDDLLVGTYSQLLDLQSANLAEISRRDEPVVDRLRAAAEDVVRTTLEDLEGATVFARSLHLLTAPAREAVREQRRGYQKMFSDLVQEGIDNGELRSDVPVDLATYHFFGAIMYLSVWFSPDGRRSIDEVARTFSELFLHGLT